jgi:hypothetical protein
VSTDVINGGTNPRIGAVAYTNSVAGATTTMLYDMILLRYYNHKTHQTMEVLVVEI